MKIHDPEDEYTVISSEGIGKGILRDNTIELTEPMKQYSDNNKPVVKGSVDGNVYAIIGAVKTTLIKAGYRMAAVECQERCLNADNYNHVLQIVQEYVDFELDPS